LGIVAYAVFAWVLALSGFALAEAPVDEVIAACGRMAAEKPGSCGYSAGVPVTPGAVPPAVKPE
jgi:hypothetical protein